MRVKTTIIGSAAAATNPMVNVSRFPKSRPLLGYMWPKGAAMPSIGPVRRTFAGAVDAAKES
jgi:hypothetical protein